MPKDIRRTVIQVEVFSEGPFYADGGENDPFDLAAINYAISEGDCIGSTDVVVDSEVVPPAEVEAHLLRIGNDGSFFDGFDGDEDGSEDDDEPGQ